MTVKDRLNVPRTVMVTGERDVITSPNLFRWLMEGKVFEAGYGLEDSAIDCESSVEDITATFSLQAPAASSLLVVPILLKLCMTDDGGTDSNEMQVSFTKPAALCVVALTLSGTALTSKHCMYRTNPPMQEQQATALATVTVSILQASDYISYHRGVTSNDILTTGLVALGEGPSNVHTFRFMDEGVPHIMTSGAAMLVGIANATTDSKWTAYMQWAELTVDDLY